MCLLSLNDWSKIAEWTVPAVLAFAFGYWLQRLLVKRQEQFQKDLLDRQLAFLDRLERDRAASEDNREKARSTLARSIADAQLEQTAKIHFFNQLNNPPG